MGDHVARTRTTAGSRTRSRPDRIAGGSSGGSAAALAAGLADAALGHGLRRLDPHPGRVLRHHRLQADHGLVPIEGCFPLAPSFDHAGPMARDVAGCERMMEALAPGFAPATLADLGDLRVGRRVDRARRPARARARRGGGGAVRRGARARPAAARRDLPAVLARGGRRAPRRCSASSASSTARTSRPSSSAALEVTDDEARRGRAARERYRERIAELTAGFDLVVTPTLEMVAPPAGVGDLALRERMIRLTFPLERRRRARRWRCRAARPRTGCPRRCSSSGAPGDDALVLAAGRAARGRARKLRPVA